MLKPREVLANHLRWVCSEHNLHILQRAAKLRSGFDNQKQVSKLFPEDLGVCLRIGR